MIGVSKWLNSLIVGDSSVTIGKTLTVHMFLLIRLSDSPWGGFVDTSSCGYCELAIWFNLIF